MELERKFLAHFLNVSPSSTATYFRLGKDLEELNVELNPEVNTKKNILGESSVKISSYEVQSSVEPYYADKGDGLHAFLQDIIDNRKVLDDVKTDAVEVHLWEETSEGSGIFTAYKESVAIEVTSYGGDNTGYQIPFNVHYLGDRVKGTFNLSTKTFTADSTAE
ncbi:MAG: hypothetical protein ACI4JX_06505 [Oscillospiraceae bacterium]